MTCTVIILVFLIGSDVKFLRSGVESRIIRFKNSVQAKRKRRSTEKTENVTTVTLKVSMYEAYFFRHLFPEVMFLYFKKNLIISSLVQTYLCYKNCKHLYCYVTILCYHLLVS